MGNNSKNIFISFAIVLTVLYFSESIFCSSKYDTSSSCSIFYGIGFFAMLAVIPIMNYLEGYDEHEKNKNETTQDMIDKYASFNEEEDTKDK